MQTNEWVSSSEAIRLLGLKNREGLRLLKEAGEIEYIEITSTNHIYSRASIQAYIQKQVN